MPEPALSKEVSVKSAPAEAPIERVKPEGPLADLMQGDARWQIPVHQHGFIALVDVMPRLVPQGQSADAAIVLDPSRTPTGIGRTPVAQRGSRRHPRKSRVPDETFR